MIYAAAAEGLGEATHHHKRRADHCARQHAGRTLWGSAAAEAEEAAEQHGRTWSGVFGDSAAESLEAALDERAPLVICQRYLACRHRFWFWGDFVTAHVTSLPSSRDHSQVRLSYR